MIATLTVAVAIQFVVPAALPNLTTSAPRQVIATRNSTEAVLPSGSSALSSDRRPQNAAVIGPRRQIRASTIPRTRPSQGRVITYEVPGT
jgi:hypothetical protein